VEGTAFSCAFVMPFASAVFVVLNVHAVAVPFTFQPVLVTVSYAPGGTMTSIGVVPVLSVTSTRRPLVTGSMVGVFGTLPKKPLKLSLSSPACGRSFVRISFALS